MDIAHAPGDYAKIEENTELNGHITCCGSHRMDNAAAERVERSVASHHRSQKGREKSSSLGETCAYSRFGGRAPFPPQEGYPVENPKKNIYIYINIII